MPASSARIQEGSSGRLLDHLINLMNILRRSTFTANASIPIVEPRRAVAAQYVWCGSSNAFNLQGLAAPADSVDFVDESSLLAVEKTAVLLIFDAMVVRRWAPHNTVPPEKEELRRTHPTQTRAGPASFDSDVPRAAVIGVLQTQNSISRLIEHIQQRKSFVHAKCKRRGEHRRRNPGTSGQVKKFGEADIRDKLSGSVREIAGVDRKTNVNIAEMVVRAVHLSDEEGSVLSRDTPSSVGCQWVQHRRFVDLQIADASQVLLRTVEGRDYVFVRGRNLCFLEGATQPNESSVVDCEGHRPAWALRLQEGATVVSLQSSLRGIEL